MDTNLGAVILSQTQVQNIPFLTNPVPFKGFCVWGDNTIIGVSDTEPTEEEKAAAVAWLGALPVTEVIGLTLQNFNAELAIGREAQAFDAAALMRFMVCAYTVNALITYKNFWGGVANGSPYPGLQQIGQGLVAQGTITQADYNALNGILKEQGIDLDNPPQGGN